MTSLTIRPAKKIDFSGKTVEKAIGWTSKRTKGDTAEKAMKSMK
jgi:hypothetical protein